MRANRAVGARAAFDGERARRRHLRGQAGLSTNANSTNPRPLAGSRHVGSRAAFGAVRRERWQNEHHVGWLGQQFWPYAYGDFFYYVLWPNQNVGPFWGYGYGDIYQAIFSPHSPDDYLQGPRAKTRMTELT